MPDESFPIEIGGETLHLRFEDKDVREIEKTLALFAAFHPTTRTYENAALFLWRGLRRADDAGNLVYAIQQGPPGREMAFQMVKAFCRQFSGTAGMLVLYGSIHKALIISGWFGEPDDKAKPERLAESEPSKNSVRPTKRPTKRSHTAFAGSLPDSSGG